MATSVSAITPAPTDEEAAAIVAARAASASRMALVFSASASCSTA